MCIILFAYRHHPRYWLVLAANRDEFYRRPSAPAHFWPDQPMLLAGRDLEQMGTWLGITRSGRLAALTNYRDPASYRPDALSRGKLVSGYLGSDQPPPAYLAAVDRQAGQYNGFNLLVGDTAGLWYYSNRHNTIISVAPGIHGLSNHLLNTPWPKIVAGRQKLAASLAADDVEEDKLWDILADRQPAPDHELPATGVSRELERALSPIFIITPDYGTRVGTLLLIDYAGNVRFIERTYSPTGDSIATREYIFKLRLSSGQGFQPIG